MARPPVRTTHLSLDAVHAINRLFGTIANAYKALGLDGLMTYAQFYRGLQMETVTPDQKILIEEAWGRWCELYLRPEVPPNADLTLTAENRDDVPTWHPDAEETDDEPTPRRRHPQSR